MRKFIAIAAAFPLPLALFACGKPATPEPLDLAAFAESPMAFDLTDLAGFLTPQQLTDLEAALREDLAARGLEDCTALYFADPPAGCVKIPFANESGADLSNLNTEQLAKHIAGQVVEAFEGKGVDVGTSVANTTTTKATTVSVTTNTSTTTKPTTKTTGNTPPDQYVIGGNLSRDRIATSSFQERTTANSGKILQVEADYGSFLIEKKTYSGNYNSEGLTLYVYYAPKGSSSYNKIGTMHGMPSGNEGMCYITLVADPNAKQFENRWGKGIECDARFTLGNPQKNGVDFYCAFVEKLDTSTDRSNIVVYQFNGTTLVKISP